MLLNLLKDSTLLAMATAVTLPFLAFLGIIVFSRPFSRTSAALSIGAVTVSLISALFLLFTHWDLNQPIHYASPWLVTGTISVPFGFLLDPASLLMLAVVAGISFLVQVYSLGYLSGDPGLARYYALHSLFASAMMSLTLSASLLQLYFFWELVGLCSYLLIGFWFERFNATQAGKKAFVMTRLGDVAFFLGLLLVLLNLGNLDILEMNSPEVPARLSSGLITLCALLMFGGVVGKSAQFPLMTWLPDAMEGPTPVSALLHSATMVAAGVYLFARLFPFFSHSADGHDRYAGHRGPLHAHGVHHGHGGPGYQKSLGLLHHQPIGIYGYGFGRRGVFRGDLSSDDPCRLQGVAFPLRGGLGRLLSDQ